jgi:hypothetical protein
MITDKLARGLIKMTQTVRTAAASLHSKAKWEKRD